MGSPLVAVGIMTQLRTEVAPDLCSAGGFCDDPPNYPEKEMLASLDPPNYPEKEMLAASSVKKSLLAGMFDRPADRSGQRHM